MSRYKNGLNKRRAATGFLPAHVSVVLDAKSGVLLMTRTLTPSSQPLTTWIGLTLGLVLLMSFAQLAAASGPDKRGCGHHDGEKRDREIVIEDVRKHTKARFERADANNDSLLTLDEMMAQAGNVEECRDSHQERRGADQKGRPGMSRWRRHGGAIHRPCPARDLKCPNLSTDVRVSGR